MFTAINPQKVSKYFFAYSMRFIFFVIFPIAILNASAQFREIYNGGSQGSDQSLIVTVDLDS